MLKTESRPPSSAAARSNRWVPSRSQASPHFASSPSRAGLSGTVAASDICGAPVRYVRHRVDGEVPECGVPRIAGHPPVRACSGANRRPHTGGMAPNPSAGRRMPRWSVRSRILATMLAVTALAMIGAGGVTFLVAARARPERGRRAAHRACRRCEQRRHGCFWSQDLERRRHRHELEPLHDDLVARSRPSRAAVLPAANESSIAVLDGEPAYVPGVDVPFRLEDDPELLDADRSPRSRDGTVRLGAAATPVSAICGTSRFPWRSTTGAPACSSPRSMWTPSSPS